MHPEGGDILVGMVTQCYRCAGALTIHGKGHYLSSFDYSD